MKQKTTIRQLALACAAGALATVTLPSIAGTARIVNAEGQTMLFEYADGGLLRVSQEASEDGYMVLRDNTLYVVAMNDGQPMVMNASSMMKGMSGMITETAPSAATAEVVSLEKTGRSETVAGIKGEVYELTVREEGTERTTEMVMSRDPRAMEFRDAMFAMARSAVDALGEESIDQRSTDLEGRLKELDQGVLRVGQDMKITAIDSDKVADARFELPAEPMDMQSLGEMFGAMGQQQEGDGEDGTKSGGLFSGMMDALGGKAERQGDRAENKVDDKVDEKTDSAVDNALDKAFGKLFGD